MTGVDVSNPRHRVSWTIIPGGTLPGGRPVPSQRKPTLTEQHKYLDVKSILPSPFDDFCIVTLEKRVDFIAQAPLCLPEDPSKEYDNVQGIVVGFGHTNTWKDDAKEQFNANKMTERKIVERSFIFKSARNCRKNGKRLQERIPVSVLTRNPFFYYRMYFQEYGGNQMALKRKLAPTGPYWGKGEKGYIWLEL